MPKKPAPWNNETIKASFSEIEIITSDQSVVTNFQYIVENKSPYDYILPNDNGVAFIRLPKTKGLSREHPIVWNSGLFLPTDQKVLMSFKTTYYYKEYSFSEIDKDNNKKLSLFMNRLLKEIDGFVILDKELRYQIDFPKGWDEKQTTIYLKKIWA